MPALRLTACSTGTALLCSALLTLTGHFMQSVAWMADSLTPKRPAGQRMGPAILELGQ
jgi:hypothetical protein